MAAGAVRREWRSISVSVSGTLGAMTQNPETTQFAPDSNRSRKRTTMKIAAVGLAGSLAAGAGLVAWANSHNADLAIVAAGDLAKDRNTCKLTSVKTATEAGKTVLKASVTMHTKQKPESFNSKFDGIRSNASFSDGNGNLQSGLRVLNKTHEGSINSVLLSSEKGMGMKAVSPDAKSDSVTIGSPVLTADNSTYVVYRQNTVEVNVTGAFVSDVFEAVPALVPCGTFSYTAGSGVQPVIK